ncbi:hypothetical protein FB45DRAFT_360587 [Roridomyces roridus]|uniref:Uncharacterized protein n=1 Tax=Roridomyces roridus TaxID=1738132 RepID=A0AAD7FWU5_9AGAR|nr:hypothetical protein FB45DRAFT_360587 [Roridomyces roridus]
MILMLLQLSMLSRARNRWHALWHPSACLQNVWTTVRMRVSGVEPFVSTLKFQYFPVRHSVDLPFAYCVHQVLVFKDSPAELRLIILGLG